MLAKAQGAPVCPLLRRKRNQRPKYLETRLKCTCHEIALSVTRQTCTWNCPILAGLELSDGYKDYVISPLLARNCCDLVVVASATIAVQWW